MEEQSRYFVPRIHLITKQNIFQCRTLSAKTMIP